MAKEFDPNKIITIKTKTRKTLIFEMTCQWCPEQYDVWHGRNQVGYVRLRNGSLTADYPNGGGVEIYNYDLGDQHDFVNDKERMFHLTAIANFIDDKI